MDQVYASQQAQKEVQQVLMANKKAVNELLTATPLGPHSRSRSPSPLRSPQVVFSPRMVSGPPSVVQTEVHRYLVTPTGKKEILPVQVYSPQNPSPRVSPVPRWSTPPCVTRQCSHGRSGAAATFQ